MNREISFTINVAIYNVEDFLEECLDSVCGQRGEDVEILLIDDGSTDRSAAICDAYAARDARVRVIHKENGGPSTARNVGIDMASGKWILLVDGDDTLTEDALEIMRHYEDSKADLVNFNFRMRGRKETGENQGQEFFIRGEELSAYRKGILHKGYHKNLVVCVWGRMWSREYLNRTGLRFDVDLRKAQDLVFSFAATRGMKEILCVPQNIYQYRIHDRAISWRFSPNILNMQGLYMAHLWADMVRHGEDKDIEYRDGYLKRCGYECWQALEKGILHPDCPWNEKQGEQWLWELRNAEWMQKVLKNPDMWEGVPKKERQDVRQYMMSGDMRGMARWCRKKRALLRRKKKVKAVLQGSRRGEGLLRLYRRLKNRG